MRPARWLWFFSVLSAGCTHSRTSSSAVTAVATDTIWYVSARARDAGVAAARLADSLEFGFVVADHRTGGDVLTNDMGIALRDSVRLNHAAFVAALRSRVAESSPADPVAVMHIHGFRTPADEALINTATAMMRSQSRIPWIVFSWPSKGSRLASPSSRAVLTNAYWIDSTAAAASKPAFREALSTVMDAVGGDHTVVVAHSMGSQLVTDALISDQAMRARLASDRLRALTFYAPDVDATQFHEVVVPSMQPLTRRLVLYASDNDKMLAVSKSINKGPRAGTTEGMPAKRDTAMLEIVDVSDGLAAGGWFQRAFGTHHALKRNSAALYDLVHLVARERAPSCRSTLGTATLNAGGDWKLTDIALPAPQAFAACQADR